MVDGIGVSKEQTFPMELERPPKKNTSRPGHHVLA
jgi:hypothetical protein